MNVILSCILFLIIGTLLPVQAVPPFYRQGFIKKLVSSSPRYFHNSNGFVPLTYSYDLHSSESKRRSASEKYPNKKPYRSYDSEEEDFSAEQLVPNDYSNESQVYNSRENDSREYTIGTQIRVQHPITVPKKQTSSYAKHHKYQKPHKASSYVETNLSTESFYPEITTKKQPSRYSQLYEADPFQVISPPKPTPSSSSSYSVYDSRLDHDYEPQSLQKSKVKPSSSELYKGIASKKQIEAYLEDQQKLLNEALKIQLLSNPNLKDLLKNQGKNKESLEEELDLDLNRNLAPPQRGFPKDKFSHKQKRPRRRPESKRPFKGNKLTIKPKRKFRSAIVHLDILDKVTNK